MVFSLGVVAVALTVVSAAPAARTSVVLRPVADARVEASRPAANFGRATVLAAEAVPRTRSYLRFRVGRVGSIVSATLMLHARDASRPGYGVRLTAARWRELRITYRSAPRPGRAFRSSGRVRAWRWTKVNVTPFVRGSGIASFAIATSDRHRIRFASREAARRYRPKLVLVIEVPPKGCSGSGTRVALAPVADAYVDSHFPGRNRGAALSLRVRMASEDAPAWNSYLKFPRCTLAGPLQGAKLRLYVVDPAADGGAVYTTSGGWTEMGIAWANAPPIGGQALATVGRVLRDTWVEVALPPGSVAAIAAGALSLALRSEMPLGGTAWYSSREGAHPPQLVLISSTPAP